MGLAPRNTKNTRQQTRSQKVVNQHEQTIETLTYEHDLMSRALIDAEKRLVDALLILSKVERHVTTLKTTDPERIPFYDEVLEDIVKFA